MKLILITGMSGAGKGVALKTLEDAGFEAIDNLPLSFLPAVAGAKDATRNLAVGVDIRSRDFSREHFAAALKPLRENKALQLRIAYLDCDNDVLQRRFTETRRRHPLAQERPAMDGIIQERRLLAGIRELADVVIDTSGMGAQELRQMITEQFAKEERKLSITVSSFSFKKGLPREADLVFDVRFLRNPHYDEALRPFTGLDVRVGAYVREDAAFAPFFANLQGLLLPLLPRYLDEGKNYLTIAIGCTGGKHRSVFTASELVKVLQAAGYQVSVRHRDMEAA